jgi:hypothetical protein
MQASTLHEIEEVLGTFDRDTLREMANQLAKSHVTVCGLTSQEGDCSHISGEETQDRIDKLSPTQLAALLAPTAWVSTEYRSQPRG